MNAAASFYASPQEFATFLRAFFPAVFSLFHGFVPKTNGGTNGCWPLQVHLKEEQAGCLTL